MMKIAEKFLAMGASALTFLFGGWTLTLQILTAAIVLDLISGVIKVFGNEEVKVDYGKAGRAGVKKLGIYLVVALAHLVDLMLPLESANLAMPVVTAFYFVQQGLSILNNVADSGELVPEFLREKLQKFKS